jgi:hypothetical protein
MNHLAKGALVAAAAGILLLGGAAMSVTSAPGSAPGVLNAGQHEWANLIIALGLIGYTAALLVAAVGRLRPGRRPSSSRVQTAPVLTNPAG